MSAALPASLSSATHIVLIPSYNPGESVFATVASARAHWSPVWVVVDGSTDGTPARLQALARDDDGLRVILMPTNQGKGAAVLHGIELAAAEGYTHVLTMDSDGQHPADLIPDFMARSMAAPRAMVLGCPVFDASAPAIRVGGRKISNGLANVMSFWAGIGDSLYGFRVYPISQLANVMRGKRWMRRFDFDPEAVVRLCWRGVVPLNVPAPVRYLRADEGGVSHFNYLRDNILLTWMYSRLAIGALLRAPALLRRKLPSTEMRTPDKA
ncbi:MAG: glycosyl transferase, family 2 [Rhodocyclales bacterium]|nr:glycosyl transferase, family 2 [Rhodocyclales bacterium]